MAEKTDDGALVGAFKDGDDSAFDRIVERHCVSVAALANRLLGWPGEVDDVVQDVFLRAMGGLRRFHGRSSLRTWLFAITINVCRTRRARRRTRLRRERSVAAEAPTESANDTRLDADSCAMIRRKIAALPRTYREVIVLTYLEQMSSEQVSAILSVSRNTVAVRLSRARDRLRQDLRAFAEDQA